MRDESEVAQALALAERGLNDSEIARLTGLPRTTVRRWRLRQGRVERPRRTCPRCVDPSQDLEQVAPAYAYLLGAYLGDGHIARFPRSVYRLSLYLDAAYPSVVEDCATAMKLVLPANVVNVQRRDGESLSIVSCYSKHWPCLFPQHGRGPKHERAIRLEPWQRGIVERHPRALLRGLIHSDGCRFTNVVRVRGRRYEYPRYNFTNASADIRAIFCEACDQLGIEWRRMNERNVSVARRGSVALLDEFVGPKA